MAKTDIDWEIKQIGDAISYYEADIKKVFSKMEAERHEATIKSLIAQMRELERKQDVR